LLKSGYILLFYWLVAWCSW